MIDISKQFWMYPVCVLIELAILYTLIRSFFFKKIPEHLYFALNPVLLLIGLAFYFAGVANSLQMISETSNYVGPLCYIEVGAMLAFYIILVVAFNHLLFSILKRVLAKSKTNECLSESNVKE